MQALVRHRGLVAPLPRRDIDTDQIIPKQFLKSIARTGFGQHLFHDWRRGTDGQQDPVFVLNQPCFAGASVLVTGPNFGCGSSREHAAWALLDYGFRVVIAPSFADIFRNNAVLNGLLPVVLPEDTVGELATRADRGSGYEVAIDLEHQTVSDDADFKTAFAIDAASRHRILHGLDEIALILQHEAAITAYESRSDRNT